MDKFVPDVYAKSIYTINYDLLKKRGIKCLLFDLDNTIAPINVKEADNSVKDLFNELKSKGFKVIIMSNSPKDRLRPFKEKLNVDTAWSSKKPLPGKYKKILKMYNFKDTEIAAVGDQLLTDILGANNVGFTSILVNPMSNIDGIGTKFNRMIENNIYRKFAQREILIKGKYYE